MLLLSEIPFDSQLCYCASFHIHWMSLCLKQSEFTEDQILGEFVSSPDACYLVSKWSTCVCIISPAFLPRKPAFIIQSMLFCSSITLPLHSSCFLSLPLYCFPLPLLYVTSRLSLTWSKYTVSQCIENFSVLMSFSLHGVKGNKLLFVCLITPHLPPPFELHSIINNWTARIKIMFVWRVEMRFWRVGLRVSSVAWSYLQRVCLSQEVLKCC